MCDQVHPKTCQGDQLKCPAWFFFFNGFFFAYVKRATGGTFSYLTTGSSTVATVYAVISHIFLRYACAFKKLINNTLQLVQVIAFSGKMTGTLVA